MEDFINKLYKNNPNIEYVSGYTGTQYIATFKCKICGNTFDRLAKSVYNGKTGCSICIENKKIEQLKEKLLKNNPNIEYISGYTDPHKQATFKCKKCGNIWSSTAYDIYTGKSYCHKCSLSPYILTEDTIRNRLQENNPTIDYLYGYKGSLQHATFKCQTCGYTWETTAFTVYTGKTGCPKCAFSKGQTKISKYLDDHNISYIPEYTFHDCKNIYLLPFDFYLPDNNTCIEYDGEHHFQPIIRSKSMTYDDALRNFEKIKKRDLIKDNYCKQNNIILLRISYTQFKNIETILDKHFL